MRRAVQGVLLADGPSDLPLASHLERLCLDSGAEVTLTPIDPRLLPRGVGRTVEGRLRYLVTQDIRLDIVFVHRDAEAQDPSLRVDEIAGGASAAGVACPVVPVVPVRMTEAWLLLDELAIRRVAGRPSGRTNLELPRVNAVERLADPKAALKDALLIASEERGRRRERVVRDFDRHRSLLLERLDTLGPVTQLVSWQRMVAAVASGLTQLREAR